MMKRYWPLGVGRVVTSPFGPRAGGFHNGVDFGRDGGSANMPVYAIQSGTVIYCGSAQGYGGDPSGLAGWVVIDSDDFEGGGVLEYGHVVRLGTLKVGSKVVAGQQIGVINPNQNTNGGVSPHLHVSDMPYAYDPNAKQDPMPRLNGALEPEPTPVVVSNVVKEKLVAGRPDFNEYAMWSPNRQDRNGTKPSMFLLHTQEGPGNADSLAKFLVNPANAVSYHYTVSEDYNDHGVTVVDVVDTDKASWSVLDYNNKSINLCFAGSSAGWTRAQWLQQSRAIDVAAYLAVQDCRKYGIPLRVVPPPYKSTPGISDHAYVTSRGIGTHTDVGKQFPWDVFTNAVNKYNVTSPPAPAPAPAPAPLPVYPRDWNDRQLLEQIWSDLQNLKAKR